MTPREIKAALVAKGVKQVTIARQVELSQTHINDVITRKRRNARAEAAIAEAIGKPVEEVFPVEPASASSTVAA